MQRLLGAAIFFLLGPFAEARWGTTLGKRLLELRILRADGSPARWRDALLRSALRYPIVLTVFLPTPVHRAWEYAALIVLVAIQTLVAAAGVLWTAFAGGRTLSDVLTGTRVVHREVGGTARVS